MIKRNNKKGFTIVELVIVIAVIAILAAVLIPTFSGIVKKAQLSSDQQAVRNMNVALAASGDFGDDMNAVIDALSENGFNSKKALIPVSKDYQFMYSKANNCIVLVNAEKVVVYPEDITYDANDVVSLEDSVKYLDAAVKDAAGLVEAITNGQMDVKLENDVVLSQTIVVDAEDKITLDLGGKKLSAAINYDDRHHNVLDIYGEVTIKGGTIETRNILVRTGAKVTIEDDTTVKALDKNGGTCLWIYEGAEVVINGGTFEALNDECDATFNDTDPAVIYNAGTLKIKGGTFSAKSDTYAILNTESKDAKLTIDGGTFTSNRGVISALAGSVTINGGTITVEPTHSSPAHAVYAKDGTVVINGGTIAGTTAVADGGTGSITNNIK